MARQLRVVVALPKGRNGMESPVSRSHSTVPLYLCKCFSFSKQVATLTVFNLQVTPIRTFYINPSIATHVTHTRLTVDRCALEKQAPCSGTGLIVYTDALYVCLSQLCTVSAQSILVEWCSQSSLRCHFISQVQLAAKILLRCERRDKSHNSTAQCADGHSQYTTVPLRTVLKI